MQINERIKLHRTGEPFEFLLASNPFRLYDMYSERLTFGEENLLEELNSPSNQKFEILRTKDLVKDKKYKIHDFFIMTTIIHQINLPLEQLLRSFWEIEELQPDQESLLSVDELACENFFKETHYRNSSGRYVVRLPFNSAKTPFLAMRTVRQLAQDEREKFPLAFEPLMHDLFMDDLVSGNKTISSGIEQIRDINNNMKSGGMHMRKWTSNIDEVLKEIPPEDRQGKPIEFDKAEFVKVLGIQWSPSTDCFLFK
ncbi:hypothetical protein Bhyg_04248, partial [Pseudolycoriella hygida]